MLNKQPTAAQADSSQAGAQPFAPADARYIKLGAGGAWEARALAEGTLEWGGDADRSELAEAGDWAGVRNHYIGSGLPVGVATAYTRELRDLHTASEDTLWITFSGGHMWWAFAASGVGERDRADGQTGRFFRRTISGWNKADLKGRELRTAELSTKLTKLSAYQQSICSVAARDYLYRVIRGEEAPEIAVAKDAKRGLAAALLPLIQSLHQDDFELFIDLLFTAMGWRRLSVLGGTMKDVDLQLELRATGERAVVQVKSSTTAAVARKCEAAMRQGWPDDRVYFVYHTAPDTLDAGEQADRGWRFDGNILADLAVDHGLTTWLLQRSD